MAGTGQQQERGVELVIQSKSLKLTGNETKLPNKVGNQENQCPSPKAQQHSLAQFFRRCRSCHLAEWAEILYIVY